MTRSLPLYLWWRGTVTTRVLVTERKQRSNAAGAPTKHYAAVRGVGLEAPTVTWSDLKEKKRIYLVVMSFAKVIFSWRNDVSEMCLNTLTPKTSEHRGRRMSETQPAKCRSLFKPAMAAWSLVRASLLLCASEILHGRSLRQHTIKGRIVLLQEL